MRTDFLSRLVRRSSPQNTKSHEEPIAQELKNDRLNTIIARLAKVYAEVARSCSYDNRVPHVETSASASDWKLVSLGRYSKEGVNYVRVRVLSAIPTFVGLDTRSYSLQKEEVLFIPYENAHVLYARGLVVPTEPFVGSTIDHTAHQLRQQDTSVSSDAL